MLWNNIFVTVQCYTSIIGYERDLTIEHVITMAFEKKNERKITVLKLKSCLVCIIYLTIDFVHVINSISFDKG